MFEAAGGRVAKFGQKVVTNRKFHQIKVSGNGRFSGTGSKKIQDRMKIERDRTGSSTAT